MKDLSFLWVGLSVASLSACTSSPSGAGSGNHSTGGTQAVGGSAGGAIANGGTSAGTNAGNTSGTGGSVGGSTGGVSGSAGSGQGGTNTGGSMNMGGQGGTPPAGAGGTGGEAGNTEAGDGFARMEALDRGLVAVETGDGVYVGWRMLGHEYEPDNSNDLSFNVYRGESMIANVADSTNYQDPDGDGASQYSVRAVIAGVEQPASETVGVWSENYLRIPLESPGNGYAANDGSAADLDGDGQYELILKWDPNNAKDNAQSGATGDVYLDGLEFDGTRLWRINLGPNIRAGAHYTQFIVMDFDGDGKAEMAVKTAPGTRDGTGEYLRMGPAADDDDSATYRNGDGYVLSGPEYLTVFDGETGTELATTNFDVARGNVGAWGDDYGNRVDRFLATGAYLDDTGLPSFVMGRGYYERSTLTAWNFRDGELTQLWKFDSDENPRDGSNRDYTGQGAHSISVANVDDDPQQEIIYGAMTVDHDGSGKCSTGLNHGDALHVSDFLPDRPGVEVFMPHEYAARPLWSLRDGNTCDIVRQGAVSDEDVGRGVAADITPDNPGGELWASSGVPLTSAESGESVGSTPGSVNFVIFWDADESREIEDGTTISKYGGGNLLSCGECSSNNGTKSTPTLSADLLGDWREEIVWRESNNSALRLYTTTAVTQRRIYTLMHDPQYRVAISWQNVAYNQPPHPSFHIGSGMAAPPKPDIHVKSQ